MAKIDYGEVRARLNMPDLTDNAIKGLLQQHGVTTQKQADALASQMAAPPTGGWGFDPMKGLAGLGHAITHPKQIFQPGQPLGEVANWLVQGTPFAPKAKPPAKAKAKAKDAAAGPSAAAQEAKLQAAIANSPWNQLMQATEKLYAAQEVPVAAAISGADTVPMQNQAINQALALSGQGPGGAGAGFLQGAQAQANAVTAPVQRAFAAEGAQYAANQGPISNALAAYANANELQLMTAPESAWLSALQSHITSNLSYYGEVPKAAISGLPGALVTAMQQSGGYGGVSGQGLVPLSSLQPTSGGGVKVAPNIANIGAPGSTGGTFPIPTVGAAPGA
jgi:hypothetical protein